MLPDQSPHSGLTMTPAARRAEYAKRRRVFDEQRVDRQLVEGLRQDGWIPFKELKTGIKVRRKKSIDELLKNRFWCILYWLGYDRLSVGLNFTLSISDGARYNPKQIDVFAIDAETAVVAECRAAPTPTQSKLKRDIDEFAALQKPIGNALRRSFGTNFKPKIIWLLVTQNLRWSAPDLTRAREANVHPLDARELRYFEEMARKVGRAAKYQFHAEFLGGKKVPALEGRRILSTRTKLGGKTVYLFSARPIDILRIAFVNHRDLREPMGAPTYQRMVQPKRLKKIGEFLDAGGYFPNTILLNFHRKPRFDRTSADDASDMQFGYLTLPDRYKSAWVIDGQHRLFGSTQAKSFERLPNLFFIAYADLVPDEEAKLFVTINNEQKTVSKKLLAELDGELKWDSTDPREQLAAIASRAIDLLNSESHGPLEDKVVPPGVKSSNDHPIDLPQFHQAIIASQLIGHIDARTKAIVPGACWHCDKRHALERLVSLLSWYFSNLRGANSGLWEGGKASKLCTNAGVAGHTRLLGGLIRYLEARDGLSTTELELEHLQARLLPLLRPMLDYLTSVSDDEFRHRFTVPFGNSGPRVYFFILVEIVREQLPQWIPAGFDEYVQRLSQDQVVRADQRVKWIQSTVQQFVIDTLKERLGEKFFDVGVPTQIYKKAHDKRSDDSGDARMPVENYLDFLDLRKIVENKERWPWFEATLSIALRDERRGKSKYLDWMDRINGLRRISAHPHGRAYQPEDLTLLEGVEAELRKRLLKERQHSDLAAIS